MSSLLLGASAPFGFVRSCFSKRARGHVVPVDLLRRHLAGVARCVGRRAGGDQAAGLRRRMAAAFSDYLVSDGGSAFYERRWVHEPTSIYRTGWGPRPCELQLWAANCADGACIDATWFIHAGAMRTSGKYPVGVSVVRGAL